MPLNLDQFLNISQTHTTSEVYLNEAEHEPVAQVRGSLRSWWVSLFKGDRTRTERTQTTMAFIDALKEKVTAKTAGLRDARQELKDQYSEDTEQIVASLQKILASQLTGERALTANVIRLAADFVDSELQSADVEKENLYARLSRDELLSQLETTALDFYQRDSLADISLTDADAQAKQAAQQAAAEANMASRGLRVVDRRPPPPAPESLAHLLRGYLAGNPPPMDYEKLNGIVTHLRSDVLEMRESLGIAITHFEDLCAGRSVNENRWTREIEPQSEEARAYLDVFKKVNDEYLGPMQTLEYFLRADLAEMLRGRLLDAKEVKKNNGETATSERALREILNDFEGGKALNEADTAFVSAVLNSKELLRVDQIRPGFMTFSGGGNPGSDISGLLDSTLLVPNKIWQVVAGQASPDRSQLVYSDTEPNPWALAVNQSLLQRAETVQDLSVAQKNLKGLLVLIHDAKGDPQEAQRLQEQEAPPRHAKTGWDSKRRVINQATMRNANEINDLEHQIDLEPESAGRRFARELNRAVRIDPDASPRRPSPTSKKDYTHGYDDDPDSGRYEASHLAPRPAASVSAAEVAAPVAAPMPTPAATTASTQQAEDPRIVGSDAQDLSIIDIDLDVERTPRPAFNAWLSSKIQTTPAEALWNVLPTLTKQGHAGRVANIEMALKIQLASRALAPVRESLGMTRTEFDALAQRIAARADARRGVESNDPYAKISFDRVLVLIQRDASLVASGYKIEDL
jgi:hypothetical protein